MMVGKWRDECVKWQHELAFKEAGRVGNTCPILNFDGPGDSAVAGPSVDRSVN